MKFRWMERSSLPTPRTPAAKSPLQPPPVVSKWHSVSVAAKPTGCTAAKALRTTRYLSIDAPKLPLPDCPLWKQCACTYKHHADRRGPPRRDEERHGLRKPRTGQSERRLSRGRRQLDA